MGGNFNIGVNMYRKLLPFLLLILIVASCSFPEEFGLPSWETTFHMNILNDSYNVLELAEEDSALVAMGDTLGFVKSDSESVSIELDPTGAVSEDKEIVIGKIEINEPEPKQTEITIQEMVEEHGLFVPGLNSSMNGQPVMVPSFELEDIEKGFDKFEEFQEVHFSSGYLDMSFTNNMIFWLGSVDGSLPFTATLKGVYTDGTIQELISLDFPQGIAPNGGVVEYNNYDISGMVIPDSLRMIIHGWSDGTAGNVEILDYYAGLDIEVDFEDFVIDHAVAPIPAQAIDDSVEVEVSDEYEIYEATIEEGEYFLNLDIENQIDLNINAEVYIDNIYDPTGNSYETSFTIPRSQGGTSYFQKDINLAGFSVGDGSEPVQIVKIDFYTYTQDTEDEVRIIDANDKFTVHANLQPLDFAYINAVISQEQDIDPITGDIEIDLDVETEGDFEMVGASQMKLDISYGNSKIPARLELNLTASNNEGETVELIEYSTGNAPIIGIPAQSNFTIIKDFSDYNLNEILSIIPTNIQYEVDPIVGGIGSEAAEFYAGDTLYADIEFSSKIDLATDSWIIPQEDGEPQTNEEDVADFDQDIYDTFKNGRINLKYINTTGVDVKAEILISATENDLVQQLYQFENPDTTKITIISIPYLETTNETMEKQVEVKQTDLKYLLQDTAYIGSRIGVYSEQGTPLSGSVQIQAELEVQILAGDHLLDD